MTAPSNANTSGLAPCPFCGGEAWLNYYEAKYSDLPPKSRCPQCRSCGASLGYLATPAKATEAWNRRVTAASAQARIAELEAEIAEMIAERSRRSVAWQRSEARADRLASGISSAKLILTPEPGDVPMTEREKEARQFLAALQQETQP